MFCPVRIQNSTEHTTNDAEHKPAKPPKENPHVSSNVTTPAQV